MTASTDRRQNVLGVITVIICVGILWGLLMPAIQPDRGSRRSACTNNIKNLALATINFETSKREYPGYQARFGRRAGGSAKIGSWVVQLLPMLEQQTLRDVWDDADTHDEWVAAVSTPKNNVIPTFYPELRLLKCPADKSQRAEFASNNYIANAGFHLQPRDPALELEWYANAADPSQQSTISQRSANGIFVNQLPSEVIDPVSGKVTKVFGSAAPVKSSDVRDGTSQTIAFSESCNKLSWREFSISDETSRCKLGLVWLYAGKNFSEGRPVPLKVISTMKINNNRGFFGSGPTSARPSSYHPGVVNTAFADGSTKSISEEIDYQVYQSLLAPHNAKSDMPEPGFRMVEDDYMQ